MVAKSQQISREESTKNTSIVFIPMKEQGWKFCDMINSVFKKNEFIRQSKFPSLFNEYSNTRAAPFTSEKTQIPITHRIGSFYSLSLQNFIVDKTTKSIKTLYDDYFYKYKSIVFEIPANELEEYENYVNPNTKLVDPKKVSLRRDTYERYCRLYKNHIPNHYIAEIKEKWLVNIVRLCLRAYNINDQVISIYLEPI